MFEPALMFATACALLLLLINSVVCRVSDSKDSGTAEDVAKFQKFKTVYLAGFLLATGSDWLQGPWMYALYEAYGFTPFQISFLFIVGYASSMFLGTAVASLSDSFGRKRFSVLYCVLYSLSCATKHMQSFEWLVLGRVISGVSTSLLHCVFESWAVGEHKRLGLPQEMLPQLFSLQAFGNSLTAITVGVISQFVIGAKNEDAAKAILPLSDNLPSWLPARTGGYLIAFDIMIGMLMLCALIVSWGWTENYGSKADNKAAGGGSWRKVVDSWQIIASDRTLLLLGLIQSAFEGSMHVFVLLWKPVLDDKTAPLGYVFATFMLCCMCGSQIFALLSPYLAPKKEAGKAASAARPVLSLVLSCLLLVAAVNIFVLATCSGGLGSALNPLGGLQIIPAAWRKGVVYVNMLIFETMVGLFFPMLSSLKSRLVPEEQRSAIYSAYRIPTNFMVVVFCLLLRDCALALSATLLLAVSALAATFTLQVGNKKPKSA